MGRITGGRGGSSRTSSRATRTANWVTVDKAQSDKVAGILQKNAPKAFGVVREELAILEAKAIKHWPEKTGDSKASIGTVHKVKKGGVVSSLVVLAPYAYYVRSTKLGKNAARALILDPSVELADRMATRIGKEMSSGNR